MSDVRNMVNFIIIRYRTIRAHENAIWCLVVKGEHLYSGSADRTVCLFKFAGITWNLGIRISLIERLSFSFYRVMFLFVSILAQCFIFIPPENVRNERFSEVLKGHRNGTLD